jgi:hypothetical protein
MLFLFLELLLFGGLITSQTWRQNMKNKQYVISCIHLEEQTKDILKLRSVSIYNHLERGEASDIWGDVGGFYVKFEFQC